MEEAHGIGEGVLDQHALSVANDEPRGGLVNQCAVEIEARSVSAIGSSGMQKQLFRL